MTFPEHQRGVGVNSKIKVPANTVLPTSTGFFLEPHTTAHAPRRCKNTMFYPLRKTATGRLRRGRARAPANLLDPIAADTALLPNAFVWLRAATPRREFSPPVDCENPLGAPKPANITHDSAAFLWSSTHPRCPSRRRSRDPLSINGPAPRPGWHRCCLYEPSEAAAELTSCDTSSSGTTIVPTRCWRAGGPEQSLGPQSTRYDNRPGEEPCARMS